MHAAVAEELGYGHAWFYDNPPFSPDVWMMLGLAAKTTNSIGLGPAVLVPALRHPMVNAAGAAGLEALAPGRVAVAFGTGFAMRVFGQRAVAWRDVEAYVDAFRGLLRGDTVLWQGSKIQMLHPDGHAPARPIDMPVLIAAVGPKGDEVARRIGDGLFVIGPAVPPFAKGYTRVAALRHGTVLDPDEDLRCDRVRAAAGPGTMVAYHYAFSTGSSVDGLPGGEAWAAVVERYPRDEQRMVMHRNHFVGLNEADEAAWESGAWTLAEHITLTGSPSQVRERLKEMSEQGVTEVVYQPAGPEVPQELERFMVASRGSG